MSLESPRPQPRSWSVVGFLLAGAVVAMLGTFAITLSGREVTFGSQNVTFMDEGGTARALARRAVDLKVIDRIPESELRTIVERMRAKALEGDVRASAFVFEVARLQQATSAPAAPDSR